MKYVYSIKTVGYVKVTVEADTEVEAKDKAMDEWEDIDFGMLEDSDIDEIELTE